MGRSQSVHEQAQQTQTLLSFEFISKPYTCFISSRGYPLQPESYAAFCRLDLQVQTFHFHLQFQSDLLFIDSLPSASLNCVVIILSFIVASLIYKSWLLGLQFYSMFACFKLNPSVFIINFPLLIILTVDVFALFHS